MPLDSLLGHQSWKAGQPAAELALRDDLNPTRARCECELCRRSNHEAGCDGHRCAQRSRHPIRDRICHILGISNVRKARAIHDERALPHPDPLTGMIAECDAEDSRGPDHDVFDDRLVSAKTRSVYYRPLVTKSSESVTHLDLSERAGVGASGWPGERVQSEDAPEERHPRCR